LRALVVSCVLALRRLRFLALLGVNCEARGGFPSVLENAKQCKLQIEIKKYRTWCATWQPQEWDEWWSVLRELQELVV
jgi:S-methylmethionine-dependent homocysteine/selenocysteine methylase